MNKKIPVGVLFSESGPTAIIEKTQLSGTRLAIERANRNLAPAGFELVPCYADPQSSPPLFAALSEKLILDHGVNVIFGCYTSSSRKAVVPVVEKYNRVLFYPTLYEGFELSPNVIYTGACPNQNIILLAEFMFSKFGKSCYLVGSDYVYPYESNRIMRELLRSFDGQVLGERYLPLDAGREEFLPIVADIRASAPAFVFSTVVGQTTRLLYEAYEDAGLSPETMPIASLTTSEAELASMRPSARAGHFTAAPFFSTVLREPRCAQFLPLAKEAEGTPLNQCWEASYFQVLLFAQALAEIGTDDPMKVIASLRGKELDAPQGRIRVDADNNHTWVFPRVGRSERDGTFTIVRESKRPVRPDPYLVSYAISAL